MPRNGVREIVKGIRRTRQRALVAGGVGIPRKYRDRLAGKVTAQSRYATELLPVCAGALLGATKSADVVRVCVLNDVFVS